MNELFEGWSEYTPTNILVKAIVEGLGGGPKPKEEVDKDGFKVPVAAEYAMQRSAAQAIAAKAGSRLPVIQGRDKGLPQSAPIFDLDEMRKKNMEVLRRRTEEKLKGKENV